MARARVALLALCATFLASGGGGGGFPAFAAAQSSSSSSSSPPPVEVQGEARVVDGDTLSIGRERIRLYGVDAPESKQTCTDAGGRPYACGAVATDALAKRVAAGGGSVRCSVREKDQYGRLVASCALPPAAGNGGGAEEDAGDYMVRRGQAVAYRKITRAYVAAEEAARARRAGIFAGEFTPPATWRYERRAGGDGGGEVGSAGAASMASLAARGAPGSSGGGGGGGGGGGVGAKQPGAKKDGCRIKGNISAKGAKIYHLPADVTYDATKIDLAAGERYFCTEEEAAAAGWRPSRAPAAAAAPMSNGAGRRR